ncbi:unnamed protein product [Allacma fusca]|uniref:Uncharacterized protein n=1 Tax=Allacma fusca TaxID=39272 RepID=A0A8J2LF54_9HEXA|nr:unnamed protein product [Allacma fusca]
MDFQDAEDCLYTEDCVTCLQRKHCVWSSEDFVPCRMIGDFEELPEYFVRSSLDCGITNDNIAGVNGSTSATDYSLLVVFLAVVTNFRSQCIRTDGSTLPVAWMKNGCRIIFNEFNLFDGTEKQFIELTRVCLNTPFQSTNKMEMRNYKIIFVSHLGFVLGVCKPEGLQEVNENWFYTIGNDNVPNINANTSVCEFSTKPSGPTTNFPQRVDYPVAVFLLRHEKKLCLRRLNYLMLDPNFVH